MSKRKYKDLEKVKIEIQRSVNEIQVAEFRDIEYKLKDVEFKVGLVEDRYKYDLMVDFANKNIGGGILNRGAVQ